jgi:hypothetical protein
MSRIPSAPFPIATRSMSLALQLHCISLAPARFARSLSFTSACASARTNVDQFPMLHDAHVDVRRRRAVGCPYRVHRVYRGEIYSLSPWTFRVQKLLIFRELHPTDAGGNSAGFSSTRREVQAADRIAYSWHSRPRTIQTHICLSIYVSSRFRGRRFRASEALLLPAFLRR